MLLLRACPRCGGDLGVDHDRDCGYLECVQCGHILSRQEELALGVRIARRGVLQHGGRPVRVHDHAGAAHNVVSINR